MAPLTPSSIETALQAVTILMLGLPEPVPPDPPPDPPAPDPRFGLVRIGWETESQPFQKITDNVTYLRAVEVDDQYNRVRDVHYEQVLDENNQIESYKKITNYTRVWEVYWTVYGPNSFDNARLLRTRLFDQDVHDQFAASELYLVTDISAPRRMPEYENGQWWERVDFSARFNELVTEELTEGYVVCAGVVLEVNP